MIRNYFKIAWRNLMKSKGYSAINIGGLAVGMAVALMIGLWVYDELTFNKYHANYDRITQVMQHASFNGRIGTQVANPAIMGPEIRTKYGNDFKYVVQTSWNGTQLLSVGDKHIKSEGIYMEPDGPAMLTLKMIKGSISGLKDPYSILLSESVASTVFGNDDPINKTIKLNRTHDVKVTGVYEDLPDNTTFRDLKVIMPWELWLIDNPWVKRMNDPWDSNFSQTFAQLADNADLEKVSAKIKNVKLDNIGEEARRYKWAVFLQPMSKWNLYNEFKDGKNSGGNIQYVWLFSIIGIFVLLLACINFMNLSTARSEKRSKEVGIRKTIGSMRWQLIVQFFAESYLIVFIAFLLCLGLVQLFIPAFNEVAGKKLTIPWQSSFFWIFSIAFIIITGLLAGSYPALFLSSFQPLKVLKGTFRLGRFAAMPRKVLVVVQFTVSVMLIIGTIIVYQQIQYAKNRPIGYTKNGLISLDLETEVRQHFDVVKQELIQAGAIEEMAAAQSPLTDVWNTNGGFDWEGKDPNLAIDFPNNSITFDYGKAIQWDIKEGRDFSRGFASDSAAFVINETAARFIGMKDPVGKTLRWNGRAYTIIGIVKDILQESPFFPVRPSLYHIGKYDNMSNLILKLNPNQSTSNALGSIEKIWKKYTPTVPFEYRFVDEAFGNKFQAEERIGKLSTYFAVLAIFISCLGLFGMASFVAEQRTKEIGIRKVLGASVFNLWGLLSKEFITLVILSCVIAAPVAYYYLNNWLTNYDYRINISWQVFILAAIAALVLTILTVSFKAIKAAMSNPIRSLRTE
ncbi:ABC transporter permease [Flavihumibacter sp. RY-1]|uniref:ABC transporter permease n=1 Tax=Flavihumibacter fluminis TaxID=2909236 RepID=A0ABS9BCA1_9BACT|nr:ABC transporter permease [Flavihumibacter fluminis]MCF1713026.1 ABC transporter permease [Flavihumibacter fluminis]